MPQKRSLRGTFFDRARLSFLHDLICWHCTPPFRRSGRTAFGESAVDDQQNPNGNQTTVDAGEEEKCRSVLPDGEKSASEGLLKAVSMRSPMPSRGIPMGSGAVAHSCALGPQGSPVRTSAVAPEHDPVERCPVLALGLAGLSSRAHASRTSSFRRCERGGAGGGRARLFSHGPLWVK